MPKKIGVLTYFWSENPGTFLQAYSTCEALKKRFPEDRVELVDCRYVRPYFMPRSLRTRPTIGIFIRDLKRYAIYKHMQKTCLVTSSDRLITHDTQLAWNFIENQRYDLIVVGSDTVLQFLPHHYRDDSVPPYWLPPKMRCNKVMCGSSARGLTLDQLSANQRKACKESINSFDLIGVRDDATFALMKDLGLTEESKLQIVPDPTFSYDIDHSFAQQLVRERNLDFSKPTVALHLPRILKPATEIASYYKSRGFQIILLGPAKFAGCNLTDISPFEWAGIFKDVRLTITYRFHDTLFSLKNVTPVVSLAWAKQYITNCGYSKYHSLLKQFGLHNTNLVNSVGLDDASKIIDIADKAMRNFDERAVECVLEQLRGQYNTFVDKIADLLTKT